MIYQIPRRIIQTGKTLDQPLLNRAVMSNLRLLHPDYEYLFFDDAKVEEFIDREFPQYRNVCDSFQFRIQKYDFFRYLAVYRYGGFYFDLDVLLASDLSDLLHHGCVFPFEALTVSRFLRDNLGMDWLMGNYAFGASAGHPFLAAVIENCLKAQRDPGWVKPMMRGSPPLLDDEFFILNSTGPGLISRTLAENWKLANTVTVLFPEDVSDTRNWNRFGDWGIHLMESSWRPRRSFVRRKFADYCWRWIQHKRIRRSRALGKRRFLPGNAAPKRGEWGRSRDAGAPLVSILIPAYNAEEWIARTIRSAVDQTWKRKEIIVVDDGSTDRTLTIARQFESEQIRVLSTENRGAAAARNTALQNCQGDYIQYLDADDLLAPEKIEKQLHAVPDADNERLLLSSPWASFYYRTLPARFVRNSLWENLSPLEWLVRKMSENLHMQTSTWLVSRKLAEAAGPWDTRLTIDDDGEYFCRVLMASEGTCFVPDTGVFYRITDTNRLSYIGNSDKKKDSLILSMKLHVRYLRSLEDSERTRKACLNYLQSWYHNFYPERLDAVAELQALATELQGSLEEPHLRRKYAWMKPLLGWKTAKWAQMAVPQLRLSCMRRYDKLIYRWKAGRGEANVLAGAL